MAGAVCPKCGKLTLYRNAVGKKCTKCGYEIRAAVNGGRGGKGQKCPLCGQNTLFNGKCRSCGARETNQGRKSGGGKL